MIYIKNFDLLSESDDYSCVLYYVNSGVYTDVYPFKIFPDKELSSLEFSEITILYGGNGSGKSTLLNIIADKVSANKKSPISRSDPFNRYVDRCEVSMSTIQPWEIKIVSSDDIFNFLLDLRAANRGIDNRRRGIRSSVADCGMSTDSFEFYEQLQGKKETLNTSNAQYTRNRLVNNNVIMESNGETALNMWQKEINDDAVYILDEPENSLSPANQLKLKKYIEESVRFYNCQFIIATHSPFLLGLKDAKIYDLDSFPVNTSTFDELENIKIYKEFFKENK